MRVQMHSTLVFGARSLTWIFNSKGLRIVFIWKRFSRSDWEFGECPYLSLYHSSSPNDCHQSHLYVPIRIGLHLSTKLYSNPMSLKYTKRSNFEVIPISKGCLTRERATKECIFLQGGCQKRPSFLSAGTHTSYTLYIYSIPKSPRHRSHWLPLTLISATDFSDTIPIIAPACQRSSSIYVSVQRVSNFKTRAHVCRTPTASHRVALALHRGDCASPSLLIWKSLPSCICPLSIKYGLNWTSILEKLYEGVGSVRELVHR